VGKKIPTEMKKQKEKFTEGCIKNGLSRDKAENIFHLIEPFAGYGFNKAHAACYAIIAYQTAYLKANYPVEYMTAVLTAESRANTGPSRDERITSIINECRRMRITILPPEINSSDVEFSIQEEKIRFGLSAIKNVGTTAIESILDSRNSKGPFTGLSNFIDRVDTSKVNRKTVESLIKTGSMDRFGGRTALMTALPDLIERSHKAKRAVAAGQTGLFDTQESGKTDTGQEILPEVEELSQSQLLAYEKELLGFYLTAHPLESHRKNLEKFGLTPVSDITNSMVGEKVIVGGIITEIKKITTKTGNNEMAFVKLEDLSGIIEMVIFPKVYARTINGLNRDAIVIISGRIDEKDNRLTILVDDMRPL
jgi:DNA polymerase-3 subunit alpha